MSTTTCPLCSTLNDPSAFIGTLGTLSHYRCRACGALYEADPPDNPSSGDDGDYPDSDDDITETECYDCGTLITGDLSDNSIGHGDFVCDRCKEDRDAELEDDDPRDRPDPEVY